MRSVQLALLAAVLAACDGNPSPGPAPSPTPTATPTPSPTPTPTATPTPVPVTIAFSFAQGFAGWQADYADFTQGQEASIAFRAEARALPVPLTARSGLLLASRNVADDVFMFLHREVAGLRPATRYRVATSVTFATNVPPGCVGIGGAPGEAVTIKAGASAVAPARVLQGSQLRVNFDKGNQAVGGADVGVLGDFAQTTVQGRCGAGVYTLKSLASASGPVVTSDGLGRLWLVIGTDSGFEGQTDIYWLEGSATLTPL